LGEVCNLLSIDPDTCSSYNDMLFQHIPLKRLQRIYTVGQPFDTLYVVHSGFLKTVLIDDFGTERILSFPMKGDLLGTDAIGYGRHSSETAALSDCSLIRLPFSEVVRLGRVHSEFENAFYRVLSRDITREQNLIGMLGALAAEARVAQFLVGLADRFNSIGYSDKLFNLRMTRQEIGSYLGLTFETVSRVMSALDAAGLINIDIKTVEIKDATGLRALGRKRPRTSIHSLRAR
jgi:CRP/FNR family transcriptional regulator